MGASASAPPSSAPLAQLRQRLGASPAVAQLASLGAALQRRSDPAQLAGEEEEVLQGRFTAQRQAVEEEELPVQGKFDPVQRSHAEEDELQMKAAPNRTGMPDGLKAGVEALSGMDMSDVRVHRNSSQPAGLQALAYAQGNDIHLAPGQERHLPHEAWHVVQQRQGRVQATSQLKGIGINEDRGLEAEADQMGQRALQAKRERP